MKIEVTYSEEFEIERILKNLELLKWYTEQGYNIYTHLKLPTYEPKTSREEITKIVKKEFKIELYEETRKELLASKKLIEKLINKLNNIFNENKNKITVYLTRYGSGGSYWMPDKIILNIHNTDPCLTTFHELVHLFVEPFVEKYKISHWKKERVVDLILNDKKLSFLKYNSWQGDYQGAGKEIDSEFPSLFKDSNKFFKKIS